MSDDGWWRVESGFLFEVVCLGWVSMLLVYVRIVASCGYRCLVGVLCGGLLLLGRVCAIGMGRVCIVWWGSVVLVVCCYW